MTTENHSTLSVARAFKKASAKAKQPQHSPFSIRFSPEERALLEQRAGTKPLGAYIRECLLAEEAAPRKNLRKPRVDDQKAAQILAALGQSRLASNLNQLAKSANSGSLVVSTETERQLQQASMAVIAMREALFTALGIKS